MTAAPANDLDTGRSALDGGGSTCRIRPAPAAVRQLVLLGQSWRRGLPFRTLAVAGFGLNERPGSGRRPVGLASRGGRAVEETQHFHRDGHDDDAAVLLGGHLHDGLQQPQLIYGPGSSWVAASGT